MARHRFKNIQVRVDWVKSHLDETECEISFPPQWIYGNGCADVLAEDAAAAATIPEAQANAIIKWYELLPQVQNRLTIILRYVIDHEVIEQGPRTRDIDLTVDHITAEPQRTHRYVHDEEGMYCSTCAQRPGELTTSEWLLTRCMGVPRTGNPIPSPPLPIHISTGKIAMCHGTILHPSHRFMYYRGQFWCTACGHTAGVSGRSLCRPCFPSPSGLSAGSSYRCRRFSRGLLPHRSHPMA